MKSLARDTVLHEDTAIVVGMFDGVHKGHQALVARALSQQLPTVVYTFDYETENSLLTTAEKTAMLAQTGARYLWLQPYDEQLKAMPAGEFLVFLRERLHVRRIFAGRDFRFGRGAAGDTAFLQSYGSALGIQAHIEPYQFFQGERISSTRIRAALKEGDIRCVNAMLGYRWFTTGCVENGNRIGSTIDFPTANITTPKLKPKNGVYATFVTARGVRLPAVTNVGCKPTVSSNGEVNIESHIFDSTGDMYGEQIKVEFVDMLRPERRFANLSDLKAQIARDKETAMRILKQEPIPPDRSHAPAAFTAGTTQWQDQPQL